MLAQPIVQAATSTSPCSAVVCATLWATVHKSMPLERRFDIAQEVLQQLLPPIPFVFKDASRTVCKCWYQLVTISLVVHVALKGHFPECKGSIFLCKIMHEMSCPTRLNYPMWRVY